MELPPHLKKKSTSGNKTTGTKRAPHTDLPAEAAPASKKTKASGPTSSTVATRKLVLREPSSSPDPSSTAAPTDNPAPDSRPAPSKPANLALVIQEPMAVPKRAITQADLTEKMKDLVFDQVPESPVTLSPFDPSPSSKIYDVLADVAPDAPKVQFPGDVLWQKPEKLSKAFLPPTSLTQAVPFTYQEKREMEEIETALLKALGACKAIAGLRDNYADASKRALQNKVAAEEAIQKAKELTQELSEVNAEAERVKVELETNKAKLEGERDAATMSAEKANIECVKLTAEIEQLQKSHALAISSTQEVTEQRNHLAEEVEKLRSALASKTQECDDNQQALVDAGASCFDAALEQIQFLNPGLSFNTEGYHWQCYVEDGQLKRAGVAPEAAMESPAEDVGVNVEGGEDNASNPPL